MTEYRYKWSSTTQDGNCRLCAVSGRRPVTLGGRTFAMTPTPFAPATVGNAIHHWRRVRKLSQRALAAMVGRSQSWVSAVEVGRIVPSIKDVATLADVLKVQLTDLLAPPGQQEPAS